MPKRKRSTFGSVARLGPDRWRIRWWEDTPEGRRRVSEVVRGTRRQADDRLAQIRVEVGSEQGGSPTVGRLWETRALRVVRARLRERSLDNAMSIWRRHVCPRWGNVPVAAVRAGDVQEWLLTLPKSPAPRCLALLRDIMREAVLLGEVPHDPLDIRFVMPDRTTKEFSHEIIHGAGIEEYAAAVRDTAIEAMFLLAACAGLRVGESLGPMTGEVTRESAAGPGGAAVSLAVVPVVRQVDAGGRVVVEGGRERLKNDHSARWAVMPEPWATRLLEVQEARDRTGLAFLTPGGLDRPMGSRAAREEWYRLQEAAGLPRIDLRNLRPTFATQMHSSYGLRTEDIARLMGHRRPNITFGTYQRPDKGDVVRSVAMSVS